MKNPAQSTEPKKQKKVVKLVIKTSEKAGKTMACW